MTEFHLQIVTPDGLLFDGNATRVVVRTTEGDVGILARHSDYVAPISIGKATVRTAEGVRTASCIGGMVSVTGGMVRIVASTFEWAEAIDIARAQTARQRAEEQLREPKKDDYELQLAEMKLKRALNRIRVYEEK